MAQRTVEAPNYDDSSAADASGSATPLDPALAAALEAVRATPDSTAAWDRAEELADRFQQPDPVAAAYREVLARPLPAALRSELGPRAAQFFEEWFGDDPSAVASLLLGLVEGDPQARWAFERLVVALTVQANWAALLDAYDRALAHATDSARRRELLDEAAQVAKDFAGDPARATAYLQAQLELDPGNRAVHANLERLLERQHRYGDLVALWHAGLADLPPAAARATRVRIAATLLDHIGDHGRALDELRALIHEAPGYEPGFEQLERILARSDAQYAVRMGALTLLRMGYDASDHPQRAIAALRAALDFAEPGEQAALHRELGARLAIAGQDEAALNHYALLLELDPNDTDARKQLRHLARRSGLHEAWVAALTAASEKADPAIRIALAYEAAQICAQELQRPDRAAALLQEVLALGEADRSLALSAAHQLSELLAQTRDDVKRLGVLEHLAQFERSTTLRGSVLAEAGRLAEALGDPDRALAAYARRLADQAGDPQTLHAIIDLLGREQRWSELVEALDQRARQTPLAAQRRSDLAHKARIQREHLDAIGDAIATWSQLREEFGDEPEIIDALDQLLGEAMRAPERAEIALQTSARLRSRVCELLHRAGEVHLKDLGDSRGALQAYSHALRLAPEDEVARAGLHGLLDDEAVAREAAEALAAAYRTCEAWSAMLELVPLRVRQADPHQAMAVWREAAALHERYTGDLSAALEATAQAFALDPSHTGLEHDLLRLADRTGQWIRATEAFHQAAQAATHPALAIHLWHLDARLREQELQDYSGAAQAYLAATRLDPARVDLQQGVLRTCGATDQWEGACAAALELCRAQPGFERRLLTALGDQATRTQDWARFVPAWDAALEACTNLGTFALRELNLACATWYLEHLHDPAGAKPAALRALAQDPDHAPSLTLLAGLHQASGDPSHVDVLLHLDTLQDRETGALHQAAQALLQRAPRDPQTRAVLARLYAKAGRVLALEGPDAPQEHHELVLWSLSRWAEACLAAGDKPAAIAAFLSAGDLPLSQADILELRLRAARLGLELGDRAQAIELLQRVVDVRQDDLSLLHELAQLCADEGRIVDLIRLRTRELELVSDPQRKLDLRLELSRLVGSLEQDGSRIDALRCNLQEAPGHAPSIEAIAHILQDKGRPGLLADILEEQARILESAEQGPRAAELWAMVAKLAETQLGDVPRAVAALSRQVALAPQDEPLDNLARLHLQQGDPAAAAHCLQQRLGLTEPAGVMPVLLRLARAQLQAGQQPQAIATLEAAFAEAPKNAEVRKLLLKLYRDAQQWEALARTLITAAEAISDGPTIVAYAREAAALYGDRLGTPQLCVPVLERAIALGGADRELRGRLAEGLRAAGRLDEARTLLIDLIEDFGRRRSPDRAAAHLALARVLRAEQERVAALDQLELASNMDASNPTVMLLLAQTAREDGQLERAERAFRALLVLVRRMDARELQGQGIGPAGVLLELAAIAKAQGQDAQAQELVESALEALRTQDAEALALQARLAEQGEMQLLQRVLELRLQHVTARAPRAQILSDLAELHAQHLGDPAGGLQLALQSLTLDPSSPSLHERARSLAAQMGHIDDYAKHLQEQILNTRRIADIQVRAELLLRLGEVMEKDRQELQEAWSLYREAEELGVREVDVWRALGRVAAARGDTDEQLRVLERLAALGEDGAETRTDALYRMAEVQLSHAETQAQGLAALRDALETEPRWERAVRILTRATAPEGGSAEPCADPNVLRVFEQAARKAGDDTALLIALERLATLDDAQPEALGEAVDLAVGQEQFERAEALLLRAVELGEALLDPGERVAWAYRLLAQRRHGAGDTPGAVRWFVAASAHGDPESLVPLAQDIAGSPGAQGDPALIARMFEALLERDSSLRGAWEPLAQVYRQLGDPDRLRRLVEETLDSLPEAEDRNRLRLELVAALVDSADPTGEAAEVLRDVLAEQPEHEGAQSLLLRLFEQAGRDKDIIELLQGRLLTHQGRGDVPAIVRDSLALAQRLADDQPEAAREVLRTALQWAPDDVRLLHAVLGHLDADALDDRSDLTLRLIDLESEAVAASLALDLAEQLEVQDQAMAVLQRAFERVPTHPTIRTRIATLYGTAGDESQLAAFLGHSALLEPDPRIRRSLVLQAAELYSDRLDDPSAAIALLEQAMAISEGDRDIGLALCSALTRAQRFAEASALIGDLLDRCDPSDDSWLALHLVRADLRLRSDDLDGAVADLTSVLPRAPQTVAPQLAAALAQQIDAARTRDDAAAERSALLGLVDVLLSLNEREQARNLLADWTDRERKDTEALHLLRRVDLEDNRWDGVVKTCARLVAIESGPDQIAAALALAAACEHLGRPEEARPGLEHARRKQPEARELRDALARLYTQIGADRELAKILMQEAQECEQVEPRVALLRRAAQLLATDSDHATLAGVLGELVNLEPDDLSLRAALAQTHIDLGDLDGAEAIIDAALEGDRGRRVRETGDLQRQKARIFGRRGDREQQLVHLQSAFAVDKGNGELAAELADLAEALGQWDLAVKLLRTITLLDSPCPISRAEAFLRQAKIAAQTGDRQRAILWARKARHEDPALEAADLFLRELEEG